MINDLLELRHTLHSEPELSGKERHTGEILRGFLRSMKPDELLCGIGGHGILAVFEGAEPGAAGTYSLLANC